MLYNKEWEKCVLKMNKKDIIEIFKPISLSMEMSKKEMIDKIIEENINE